MKSIRTIKVGLNYKEIGSGFGMPGGFKTQLFYILIMPAFFFGFSILYNPFDIQGYFSGGNFTYNFHLLMASCIIFGCILLLRLILYAVLRHREVSWWYYAAWCLLECFVCSAFIALYSILFKRSGENYIDVASLCMKYVYLILCYPYTVLSCVRIIKLRDREMEAQNNAEDNSLIRFYDEHKRLKLTIAPSSILYVSSEFNYVKIHYLDAGKVMEFTLRASMKSIEAMNQHCLVRCQRSYFVNPEHVTVLRKDKEGFIYAQLNLPDVPEVPVSKQYYEALSKLL